MTNEFHVILTFHAYYRDVYPPLIHPDRMWAKSHCVKGGRNIALVLRPDKIGRLRALLSFTAYKNSDKRLIQLKKVSKESILAQKSSGLGAFQDADWEIPRILNAMNESEDFYVQHVAQIRVPRKRSGDFGWRCGLCSFIIY